MNDKKCSMHTDQTLVWEEGGEDKPTVHGRWYCPKCSEILMRALDDVEAGRLYDKAEVRKILDAAVVPGPVIPDVSSSFIFEILNEHVGSATQFCVACPDIRPERDAEGELPDDRWWIKKHQAAKIAERMDDLLCNALSASDGFYDQLSMKEHVELLIERMREEKPPPTTTHDA